MVGAQVMTCSGCSGGRKVGDLGRGAGVLTFNGVTARAGGTATVTIAYVNGATTRTAQLSVNGAAAVTVSFTSTGSWSTPGTVTVTVQLRAGANTLRVFNNSGPAPDLDKITVDGVGARVPTATASFVV